MFCELISFEKNLLFKNCLEFLVPIKINFIFLCIVNQSFFFKRKCFSKFSGSFCFYKSYFCIFVQCDTIIIFKKLLNVLIDCVKKLENVPLSNQIFKIRIFKFLKICKTWKSSTHKKN